jgi:polyisoprenyl-phosphate glycosyltransferase
MRNLGGDSGRNSRVKISICIPVYNAEDTIERLYDRICQELKGEDWELVIVNDASRDQSEKICAWLAEKNTNITFISLRKNFGEHNAVMCALHYCTGDYAVIVDDDFQNPPEEIINLVREGEKGYDVVYSKFNTKNHSFLRNWGSYFNNQIATWLLSKPKELYLSSFKVIHRDVINEIIKYTGPFPYVDGLILRTTDNISSVLVDHNKRKSGHSNYTFGKLVSLWLNMFVNFSIKPLRLFMLLGVGLSFLSAILLIYIIADNYINPEQSFGWPSIMVAVIFFAGVQIMFLGLIGEYLGKQYLTANQTPPWVVKMHISPGGQRVTQNNKQVSD